MWLNIVLFAFTAIFILGVGFYVLRGYYWHRAYNMGFADGKANAMDAAGLTWIAHSCIIFERNRRAYILGARHAKGY